ncbi:MAG: hypothetical protein LRY27_01835 [Chitinophagales bacterium]|nr:hypothetical protein [Chitinophagales bacterium]
MVLDIDGIKTWIMHGDKYDKSVRGGSRGLAISAGKAFDKIVSLNRFINDWESFLGKRKKFILPKN